jgi:transcriptional regulator with XRE-family HTH domain
VTKRLDPARDDAGMRLRAARLRRGMSQVILAEMACISASFVSMVETGERELTRVCDIVALAEALKISPLYLADGRLDTSATGRPIWTVPFPALCDPVTLARHEQFAGQFLRLARGDGRAAGEWLRRLARDRTANPWLLIDRIAVLHTRPPSSLEEMNPP